MQNRINFYFSPAEETYAVEKDVGGGKTKRFLTGVSSGLAVDAHGEQMTKNAIASFMKQAESGEILLYPDVHGIKSTDDIGILVKGRVLDNGDWHTEYQLYDGSEGAQPYQVQKANVMWNQAKGLPPYKKKKIKGFSIEGFIPDEAIIEMGESGDMKAIDDVVLDGIVVVPRPAYTSSIASAVSKALGTKIESRVRKDFKNRIKDKINLNELNDKYFVRRTEFQDVLEEEIEEVMRADSIQDKQKSLIELLDEFKEHMIDLIMNSAGRFLTDDGVDGAIIKDIYGGTQDPKGLEKQTENMLVNFMKKIIKKG